MGNTPKLGDPIKWYLCSVCKYNITNATGRNNILINIVDIIVYLVYLYITVYVLWTDGITTLPFVGTVLLIVRSFLNYRKSYNKIKKANGEIAIVFMIRMIVYALLIIFICALYLSIADVNIGKVLLSLCYAIFALFELTDILADCYEAVPLVYTKA